MEEIKIFLEKLIYESTSKNIVFKRNILKEYFQILVLDYIYSNKNWNNLIFYGGSCLSHCYGLPRLSEDLDFISLNKNINIDKLSDELKIYFKNRGIDLITKCQKFRIYLKFPILKELKLVKKGESNFLFLKIEIYSDFDFCKNYKIEVIPIFKFNKSVLIKTFDIETLMATKLRAIFLRKWEKTTKNGKTIAKVKGRDYFDLMWYLEKGVKPNLFCLGVENIKNFVDLKENLKEIIEKLDEQSIKFDLEPLIEDERYVETLSRNIKDILKRNIEKI